MASPDCADLAQPIEYGRFTSPQDFLMSDDFNISYSFQMEPAPEKSRAEIDNTLIAFNNCDMVHLGDSGTLVLNRQTGRKVIVANEVATALTYCNTFKSLDNHARHLVETIPQLQGQLEDVRKVLSMVRESELFISSTEVLPRLNDSTGDEEHLAPVKVFILTCDRPRALERLLDSLLRLGELSRFHQLVVIDDSRQDANADQNRELVARFNLSSAKNMHYFVAF